MTVRISIIGPIEIDWGDGRPRRLSIPQAQLVFTRLVLERATGTSRDQLADTLWPGGLPATWASALRSVVSRVRSFVAPPAACSAVGPTGLTAESGRYQLTLPEGVEVDLEVAEVTLAAARSALTDGDLDESRRHAEEVIAATRQPFLVEHEGEWVDAVRERVTNLHVAAIELASRAAAAQGDDVAALAFADAAVARAPLRESAHRAVMGAHAAAGNRAEALAAYYRLRRQLAEELGVDPSAATEKAYLDLLSSPSTADSSAGSNVPVESFRRVPFVGRQRELSELADQWALVTRDGSRMLLIEGETGVGKTRLATEAVRHVGDGGGVVLFGRCDRQSSIPHQAVVEALQGYLAATPADLVPSISAGARRVIDDLLDRSGSGAAGPLDEAGGSTALAIGELLVGLARSRPVALVIDDIDAAADETLALLRHVLGRAADLPLWIVATGRGRSGGVVARSESLQSVQRDGLLVSMQLGGLDGADLEAIIAAVGTGRGRTHSAHRLMVDTGGNPYLVVELLRWHGERLAEDATDLGRLPPSVHEYATTRTESLSAELRSLLYLVAAAGSTFEADVAASAAGVDPDDADRMFDELRATGLVSDAFGADTDSTAAVAPPMRFVHDVVRRVLLDRSPEHRRREYHSLLADAIEERRPDRLNEYAQLLAHHRAAAAPSSGDRRAVHWGWRAAAHAARSRPPAEVVRLHREALASVPSGEPALRAEALTNLGRAELVAGHAQAEQTLLDGAVAALGIERYDLASSAALGLADVALLQHRGRAEAESIVADLTDRAVAGSLPPVGDGGVDDLTVAELVARRVALQPAAPAGPMLDRAIAPLVAALPDLEGPGNADRRRDLAHALSLVAGAAADPVGIAVAAHHAAMAAAFSGDELACEESLATLATVVLEGDRLAEGASMLAERSVAAAVTSGRFADASAVARLLDLGGAPCIGDRRPGVSKGSPLATACGSVVPGGFGRRQMEIGDWLRGLRTTRRVPPDATMSPSAALRALLAGDRGRAHVIARSLATGARPMPCGGDEWAHEVGVLAIVAFEIGDRATAASVLEMLAGSDGGDFVCGAGYRSYVAPVAFHVGRLASIVPDAAEPESSLTSALYSLSARTARPWMALAQATLAEVLDARGRPGDRRRAELLRSEARWSSGALGLPIR